uniref:Protein C10 n=1 Tax=Noctiluca scintillans TaxID=2966 RepID=A0A7S1F313_NOCSC
MAVPTLSKEQAKELLVQACGVLCNQDSKQQIRIAMDEAQAKAGGDPLAVQIARAGAAIPLAASIVGGTFAKYGFDDDARMLAVMQIQMHALGDADMSSRLSVLMDALQGISSD